MFSTSIFRGIRLLCGAVAFHLHPPPVVNVPPGGSLPLHLLQGTYSAATAVAAWAYRDLGNSGQRHKQGKKCREEANWGKTFGLLAKQHIVCGDADVRFYMYALTVCPVLGPFLGQSAALPY